MFNNGAKSCNEFVHFHKVRKIDFNFFLSFFCLDAKESKNQEQTIPYTQAPLPGVCSWLTHGSLTQHFCTMDRTKSS